MSTSTLPRAVLACLTAVLVAASVGARLSGSALASIFDNLHWTVGSLIAAVFAFEGWRRSRGTPDDIAARWFFGGVLAFLVGQFVWDAQVVAAWLPFPGPSDVFYLLLGPGLTVGLWTIGRRRLSPTDWHAARLDAASLGHTRKSHELRPVSDMLVDVGDTAARACRPPPSSSE